MNYALLLSMSQNNVSFSQYNRQDYRIEDAIDFVSLLSALWKLKKSLIIGAGSGMLVAVIVTFFMPKGYVSTATFFISSGQSSSSPLGQYASFFGGSVQGNTSSLIETVLKSHSMQVAIASDFKDRYKFELEMLKINSEFTPDQVDRIKSNYVISKLKLGKKFNYVIDPKTGLFRLSYSSLDPKLCQLVLQSCLQQILNYNQGLNISSVKNLITVVDPPFVPLAPSSPNSIFNLLIGAIGGFIAALLFAVFRSFRSSN